MDRRVAALIVLAAFAAAAYPGHAAVPAPPQVRNVTLEVTAIACVHSPDGVCLAYNGMTPGPMLDVNLGDTLFITLENRIPQTIASATTNATIIAALGAASVSWHVHGTALGADSDGILAHPGTQLIASVAPPGGNFTYRVRTAFVGTWHYHDHVLGADGAEGVARGLYGGLVVRSPGEPRPDHVFDLHMVDGSANGGRGLNATIPAGDTFQIVVVGLGNRLSDVFLIRDGDFLDAVTVGPGMSDRIHVSAALPGDHVWDTSSGGSGTIEVTP